MRKTLKRLGVPMLALVVAFTFLAAAGCKKSPGEKAVENMIEKATGGKAEVDASSGTLKIKTAEGETQIGALTEWPSDLPEGFPKFEGKIASAARMAGEDMTTWIISLAGVKEAAVTTYIQALKDAGWNELFSTSADQSMMSNLEKDKATVMVAFNKEQSEVGLSISFKKGD
jgi:hypothetical protein